MIVSGRDAVHQVVDKVHAHAGVRSSIADADPLPPPCPQTVQHCLLQSHHQSNYLLSCSSWLKGSRWNKTAYSLENLDLHKDCTSWARGQLSGIVPIESFACTCFHIGGVYPHTNCEHRHNWLQWAPGHKLQIQRAGLVIMCQVLCALSTTSALRRSAGFKMRR